MPIAKEQLKIGFTVAANPGGYVTKGAVAEHGWAEQVDDGPDVGGTGDEGAAKTPAKKAAAKAES